MNHDKLRRQITYEAARILFAGQESQYQEAKWKAARRLYKGWIRPELLPTNQEIRDEIQSLARLRDATHEQRIDLPPATDRFRVYQQLLDPLETVRQDSERHPEGDALYHSLQVFVLARAALPYDEEFQLAALLHDVGKGLDPRNHVQAALTALNGHITPRTAWLIEHHSQAAALRDGTLGARARRRLEASEDFDDLMLLCDCDRQGRAQGATVPDVQQALDQLRELEQHDEECM